MSEELGPEGIEEHALWLERQGRLQSARFLRALSVQISTLEKQVYVPGLWGCAKCDLKLVSNFMCASTGNMAANNSPQQCANGCGPMWRVTEREAGNDMVERCAKLQERLAAIEAGGNMTAYFKSQEACEAAKAEFLAKDNLAYRKKAFCAPTE